MSAPVPVRPAGDLRVRGTAGQGDFRLDVDVRATAGQVTAVVGPNGAGKSTLLRVVAGLLALDSGRAWLESPSGPDVVLADAAAGVHLAPHDRRTGVLFQDYRLFPHLSARDNVAFGLRTQGVGRRPARAQADDWLAALDLAGLGDRRPAALSGGQAQRVALARALASRPSVLLLDEPLAALDAGTRAGVRAQLRRHLAGFPGPSLLVTHDPLEAMTLADVLVVLEQGRVVQSGAPADVARRPRTRYVGQLVGLNVWAGTARGSVLTTAEGATVHVVGGVQGPAVATVRPSAVTLHAQEPGPASARNTWRCRLDALEPFGDRVRATLSGELPVLADLTLAAVADLRLAAGDTVWAGVKATEIDVYPTAAP